MAVSTGTQSYQAEKDRITDSWRRRFQHVRILKKRRKRENKRSGLLKSPGVAKLTQTTSSFNSRIQRKGYKILWSERRRTERTREQLFKREGLKVIPVTKTEGEESDTAEWLPDTWTSERGEAGNQSIFWKCDEKRWAKHSVSGDISNLRINQNLFT